MAVGVVALGFVAIQVPTNPVLASERPPAEPECRVPVFVTATPEKTEIVPKEVYVYWGCGVVFEIVTGKDDTVAIEFKKSPFHENHGPWELKVKGPKKAHTPGSQRSEKLPPPDRELIGTQKKPSKFEYTVQWYRPGQEPKTLDPMIIIYDNGR